MNSPKERKAFTIEVVSSRRSPVDPSTVGATNEEPEPMTEEEAAFFITEGVLEKELRDQLEPMMFEQSV